MSDTDLKENTAGAPAGDLAAAGESEASRRSKAWWANLTPEEKAAHQAKAAEGRRKAQEKKRAKARGDRSADDAPRPRSSTPKAPPADARAAELAAIKEGLTIVLCAPSMVGTIKGDPWLTQHFLVRGPALAEAITDEAARNDQFRAYLVKVVGLLRGASLIGATAMYVGPVMMHMGAMPNVMGVPVVGRDGPTARSGAAPHFVAPERGPATRTGADLSPQFVEDQERIMAEEDGFAEELGELRRDGAFAPPLPMEAV